MIDDIYRETRFDVSGTKRFSDASGLRVVSLLCVPIRPRGGEVIGVLQLMNAQDGRGAAVPFDPEIVGFVEAVAAQAAVAIENQNLLDAQKALLDATIQMIAGAIDAKSAHTGGHCERVPELAVLKTIGFSNRSVLWLVGHAGWWQERWIGRSVGARVRFAIDGRDDDLEVFTTRPDTLFGAAFVGIAPDHPLGASLKAFYGGLAGQFGPRVWRMAPLIAAVCLVMFGVVLDRYVASFVPQGQRVLIILGLALGAVPFMLGDALLTEGGKAPVWRVLLARGGFLVSLIIAVVLDFDGLMFLLIILPVILLFFLLFGTIAGWIGRRTGLPAAAGLGLGLVLAWSLGVTFPIFAP